ncbi:MAG TPA: Ig-like domain-containing protein [Terriglobales bacterium]|nr:Ig-like domain-containing protein [Terriglobales bacterium]
MILRDRAFMAFLAAGALMMLSGCGGGSSLKSITVSPASPSILVGNTQQFAATDNNNNNISSTVTWTSSNPSVISISSSGLATALLPGGAQITAASGSVSGTAGITVNLEVIVVNPSNPFISNGQTLQFSATGLFSGFNQDITNDVSWTSSNTAVATISNTGLAASVATGTTTITATSGSFSNSSVLSVQ